MIHFKPLSLSNIDSIVEMMQDFYAIDNYPIDTETSKTLFQTFILNKDLGRCWLICNNESPIGYIILTFVFSFEYKGRIAFVDELFLTAEHRGNGIGQKTIDFIKTKSTDLGLKLLYLEVEHHNLAACNLYLKNNFAIHNRNIMKYVVEA